MIKTFCDGCGTEIDRNYITTRLRKSMHLEGKKFTVEVIVSKDNVINEGDICLACLFKVLNEGGEE